MKWLMQHRRVTVALLAATPLLAGCGAADFSLKDAEWFNRPTRMFNRSLTLETPPLSDDRPVAASDLISAEGYCAGMMTGDANAMTDTGVPAGAEPASGGIAIGRSECDVARVAGQPDNVSITNEGGQRITVLTYVRGPRPGIYRFAGGRLNSMERGAEPEPAPTRTKGRQKARHG
ncbi:hypothetical protein X566_19215 [Afipia sp. P52-10]|jgi:hypothetical protein|nr:hypothetical protein X566_19215 [Afipia sp. P52-10]